MAIRSFAAPHSLPRKRVSQFDYRDETCFYASCDEALATDAVDDESDNNQNLNSLTNCGVGPSLIGAVAGGSRTFAFNGWATRVVTSAMHVTLDDNNLSVGGWMRCDAVSAGVNIIEYGAWNAAPTTADNALLGVGITATKQVRFRWQPSTLVAQIVLTGADAIVLGRVHHIECVRYPDPANPTTRVVGEIWVDGVRVAKTSNLLPAFGGSNGRWIMGGSWISSTDGITPGLLFSGAVEGWRVIPWSLGEDAIVDSYARGVRDWDEADLLFRGRFKVAQRVVVEDSDGTSRDLRSYFNRDFVVGTMAQQAVDDAGPTGEVQLKREVFKFKLSPFASTSPINLNAAGSASVLLQGGRRIKVQRAVIPEGRPVLFWHWQTRLSGFIGRISWNSDPITVEVLSEAWPLQVNGFVQVEETYDVTDYGAATTTLEAQAQRLVDDYRPGTARNPASTAGYKGQPYSTATPRIRFSGVAAGWALGAYNQGVMSVWDAVGRLAQAVGFRWAIVWDEFFQEYRPTLYDPPRTASTPDLTLPPSVVVDVPKLEHDLTDVRNRGTCRIYDAAAAALTDGESPYVEYVATDATSQLKYGLQPCTITEGDTSLIDSGVEAQRLVDGLVGDCKEPLADGGVELRYDGHIDNDDVLRLSPDGQRWDTNLDLAVVGWRDEVKENKASLVVDLHQKPVSRTPRGWRDQLVGIGAGRRKRVTPAIIAGLVASRLNGAVDLTWNNPVGRLRRDIDRFEIHVGNSAAFAMSSATLHAFARTNRYPIPVAPGPTRFFKVVPRDFRGNVGPVSAEVSTSAKHRGSSLYGRAHLNASLGTELTGGKINNWVTGLTITSDPFSCFSTSAVPSTRFTAPVAGTYRFDCGARAESLNASSLSDSIFLRLFKNGAATMIAQSEEQLEDNEVKALINAQIVLAAADTIDMSVVCALNNGSTYSSDFRLVGDANGLATWFAFTLVDEA
jgi:hypothetical protein